MRLRHPKSYGWIFLPCMVPNPQRPLLCPHPSLSAYAGLLGYDSPVLHAVLYPIRLRQQHFLRATRAKPMARRRDIHPPPGGLRRLPADTSGSLPPPGRETNAMGRAGCASGRSFPLHLQAATYLFPTLLPYFPSFCLPLHLENSAPPCIGLDTDRNHETLDIITNAIDKPW